MKKVLTFLLLFTFCTVSFADTTISEDSVKAAFIFHFISYTQWNDSDKVYYVCIPDDADLRESARELFQGKTINNHNIVVSGQSENCNVLVSDEMLSTNSIMTIGSLSKGALFEFRVIDNKIKFAVNIDKVKRFKFKISSQLLKLAIMDDNIQ